MSKRGGHWCWCCDAFLPNERFRGRDHGRHLCKDCRRLPEEVRAWRQIQRNILRIWTRPGKKSRRAFAAFLRHEDPRVRAFARELHGPFREDLEDPELPWPLALQGAGDPGPSDVDVRAELAEEAFDEEAFDEEAFDEEAFDLQVWAAPEVPSWLHEAFDLEVRAEVPYAPPGLDDGAFDLLYGPY